MLKKIKLLALITLGFVPLALAAAPAVTYASTSSEIQSGIDQATGGNVSSDPAGSLSSIIRDILNILSAFAGILAVVMIIVAGFRYTASAGSEESVKKAKSSIVYAIIGVVIVAVAQVIVHFVIVSADGATNGSSTNNPKTSTSSTTNPTTTKTSSGGLSGSSATGAHGRQAP